MKYLALATNNETWCDKIRLSLDDQCYWFMADKKKDERLCLKINKGDIPIMKCLKDLAIQKGNPKICNLIQGWYEEALIKAGKEPNLSIQLTKNISEECVTEATEIAKRFPFRKFNYTTNPNYFNEAKIRLNGTLMERLIYGNPTIEDCNFVTNTFNRLYREGKSEDALNLLWSEDDLGPLCRDKLPEANAKGFSNCERKDYQSGWDWNCLYSVGLNSFGKDFDTRFGELTDNNPFTPVAKRFYGKGWIISNAKIRVCLDFSGEINYCLNPIAGLWLDCNVCNFMNDENEENLCKQSINKYSNGKISCL